MLIARVSIDYKSGLYIQDNNVHGTLSDLISIPVGAAQQQCGCCGGCKSSARLYGQCTKNYSNIITGETQRAPTVCGWLAGGRRPVSALCNMSHDDAQEAYDDRPQMRPERLYILLGGVRACVRTNMHDPEPSRSVDKLLSVRQPAEQTTVTAATATMANGDSCAYLHRFIDDLLG